ncbi:MAG TPA: tRNA (adenosine(37)-N6)-dimethylallyltransferase MiaA [Gemmatimonadaceae bacterium]|nr:tRNA (adenosine(37)-N6)-dimethylallyltransferase MiaA [Gemmatimonadaceae bacterium]
MAASSLRVICGPTAAGKSAIALWLAERYDASIVSADSRQVYRGFDIGTAKPTLGERQRVPHYGIDILEPTRRYSAAEWATDAAGWVEQVRKSRRAPVVVGGTGFYLRALFQPLFDAPPLDPSRREALAAVLHGMTTPELRRWCSALDPERARLGRPQLLRAIEVALLTGQRVSRLHADRARAPHWTARYLLVDPGPALAARIERRVDAMLVAGWMDEVRQLSASVPAGAPAWKASGYEVLRKVVSGAGHLDPARERVVIETRQYAKRQRTWFRHQLAGQQVVTLDPGRPDWTAVVDQWWHATEEA